MVFSLKKEQESAMRHIFNGKDVMAILLTGFSKSLIFQLFVTMCGVRSKRQGGIASLASLLFLRCKVLFKVLFESWPLDPTRQEFNSQNTGQKIHNSSRKILFEIACDFIRLKGSLKSKILSDFV